ncbi:MAG: hypothetical protein DCF16_08350 [Alphaproteobacteria bacterium]|nr:MAG: hypothetical protein DCF16_08350 [Alphaproteobacteria bacterium]
MKKFLVGAVATAALLTPCVASADTNAVVGVQYNSTEIESFDWDSYGINGAVSHDFSNGTLMQFDANTSRVDISACCNSSGYAALHYGVRNEGHGFGGFVVLEDFFGYSGAGLGVEGQLFMNNIVVNGSLGYVDFNDLDFSLVSGQVDGAYYFTENFAVTGLVAYTQDDGAFDEDWVTWGIGGEWRFNNSPASIELGYRAADIDDDDVSSWMIGVNLDLGTGTLRERASSGPSFNGAEALHSNLNIIAP